MATILSEAERFSVNVIAARFNLTSLDFAHNFQSATLALEKARRLVEKRADSSGIGALTILAFPGLVFTGSECGDAFLRPAVLKAAMDSLLRFENVVPDDFIVTLGIPLAIRGKLYRAHVFICDGKIRGFSCATVDDLSQRVDLRQFTPWKRGEVAFLEIGGRKLPVGDLGFEEREGLSFEFSSVDRLIAESGQKVDPFYNSNALDEAALYGASEVVGILKSNGSGSATRRFVSRGTLLETYRTVDDFANFIICRNALPFALGRQRKVRDSLANLSERYGNCIVYPVPEGVESGSAIYDGGATIACNGSVLQARRFQYEVEPSCDAFASLTMNASKNGGFVFDVPAGNDLFFQTSIAGENDSSSKNGKLAIWETDGDVLYEEFARAVPYGLFDYMRKCRANGFALSMSGGADSATLATLVRLGVKFSCASGIRAFLRWTSNGSCDWSALFSRFPKLEQLQKTSELWQRVLSDEREECAITEKESDICQRDIVSILLTTFYQATRNSSEITRTAAREVASACGATHYEFDVDPIIEQYKEMIADAMNDSWRWDRDDVSLQNIQARGRGPSAWLVANKTGRLLLATGNRSEVACGYATMDGDTCGGISPIAGVDKAFIRKWLVWMERTGVLLEDNDGELPPCRFSIPALRFINEQQPTAELRPLETKQTDEADLMPYPILNAFERALIRDRLPFADAVARVSAEAPELGVTTDAKTLSDWGRRFCNLWNVSQWKRQRYAPGFMLDDYDLAPTSWTVYPIVSAGFLFEFDR